MHSSVWRSISLGSGVLTTLVLSGCHTHTASNVWDVCMGPLILVAVDGVLMMRLFLVYSLFGRVWSTPLELTIGGVYVVSVFLTRYKALSNVVYELHPLW